MKLKKKLKKLLRRYERKEGTDEKGAIRDLLTEIIALCRRRGLDFDDRAFLAKLVCDEEQEIDEDLLPTCCQCPAKASHVRTVNPGITEYFCEPHAPTGASPIEPEDLR